MLALLFILVMITAALFGMMGLGSGIIYVPLLSWWGLDFATGAIPLGLLLSVATGAGTAYTYMRKRLVHVKTGLATGTAAVFGAPLGVLALQAVPISLVKIILAATAFYVALRALRSGEPLRLTDKSYLLPAAATLFIGFLMGFFSALVGVGGGFLLVPILLIRGYPAREAVGTTSLVVTISTFSAFLFHLPDAGFPLKEAIILAAAALAGAGLGGVYASRQVNPKAIRILIGIIIMVIAFKVGAEGVMALLN
ncbi:MAG: sulfite exporter TauE/SafE family protein [bacterium]|nr:sulfite exporter TauE/SafE family protein [bacterium]MDT8365026.1 sulfite exporter TauE/SafE family protein [bacterium]